MRTVVWAGVLAVLAAPAAHAQSEAEQRAALEVFRDYAPDGRIDPCKHTANELKLAQDNVPPDIEQYAADYPAAIAAAIDARARGACDPKAAAAPSAHPDAGGDADAGRDRLTRRGDDDRRARTRRSPTRRPLRRPRRPASDAALERVATATTSNDAPAPVLGLGLLAAALALVAIALVAMRRFGVGDDRLAGSRARHPGGPLARRRDVAGLPRLGPSRALKSPLFAGPGNYNGGTPFRRGFAETPR